MHYKTPVYTAIAAAVGIALVTACNKPSPFGADLLQDQIADYQYTDTISLNCSILREDSVITSDISSTTAYFLCGTLEDPLFGQSTSDIYAQVQLSETDPDFAGATLDSVVLYLRYNASGFYGDTLQPQTLRVNRLTETLVYNQKYYSNSTLASGEELGVLADFYPKPRTLYNNLDTASTATKAAYISLRLKESFGNELMGMDSATLATDTAFFRAFKGLRISATGSSNPGLMMAFHLNSDPFSFIRLYYHVADDTLDHEFDYYFLGANKFTHFTHNYGSSPAGLSIGNAATEYLYAQGMTGLKIKVEMPYIDRLQDIVVNKAELELTAATIPGDNALLTPANQFILTELQGDTTFVITSDVLYSIGNTLSDDFGLFGGFPQVQPDPVTAESVTRYRLTLTQRLQSMIDDSAGDIKKKTLYLNINKQGSNPARSVFYGPKNTKYPARLTLKYTRIPN